MSYLEYEIAFEKNREQLTYHLWNYDFQNEVDILEMSPEFLELDYPEVHQGLEFMREAGMTEREIRVWLSETTNKIQTGEIKY
jgi:hypothetical protein